jgi:hypothetical protein
VLTGAGSRCGTVSRPCHPLDRRSPLHPGQDRESFGGCRDTVVKPYYGRTLNSKRRAADPAIREVYVVKPLLARFTIPLGDETHGVLRRYLVFRHWLPLREGVALTVSEGDVKLRFWIDKECLQFFADVSLNEIGKYANIFVGRVKVEASGVEISDQLAEVAVELASEYNFQPNHLESTYGKSLLDDYENLGRRFYLAAVKRFNRIVAYVRAVKGQHWLEEYKPDPNNLYSEFLKFKAKVKIGESDWLRLTGLGKIYILASAPTGQRLIGEEDWSGLRDFLGGERKVPLVGQLLAAADEFRESGHRRAALTEAVSALEVAVIGFARRANPERWSARLAGRCSADRFRNHIEHLGTTCTVGYLFPIIFSEEELPSSVLKTCQEAITKRNEVIHAGTRDVNEANLVVYLQAIRDLCGRLQLLQGDKGQE